GETALMVKVAVKSRSRSLCSFPRIGEAFGSELAAEPPIHKRPGDDYRIMLGKVDRQVELVVCPRPLAYRPRAGVSRRHASCYLGAVELHQKNCLRGLTLRVKGCAPLTVDKTLLPRRSRADGQTADR